MAPLLGLMLGCGSSQPAYLQALDAGLEDGLILCAQDAECALGVLRDHDAVDRAHCQALPRSPFRDECLFLVAEGLADGGDDVQAAEVCARTGGFRKSCLQHGWDRAAERAMLASPQLPGPEAEGILASAAVAYGGDLVDADAELWHAFWWAWWEREGPIDATRCPDERCVEASRLAAMRRGFRAGCGGDVALVCVETDCAGLPEGRALACSGARDRPWTPTFR